MNTSKGEKEGIFQLQEDQGGEIIPQTRRVPPICVGQHADGNRGLSKRIVKFSEVRADTFGAAQQSKQTY